MKYIIIFTLLAVLYISYLFFETEIRQKDINSSRIKAIPKVEIIKEIDFTISKDRYDTISFNGDFNNTKNAKEFLELFSSYKVVSKVLLDSSLKHNEEVTSFTKKVISKFLDNKLPEWSIIYRDRKLLIEGKCFNENIKHSIETILSISSINYFNNIKVIKDRELEVVENLKHIIPKRDNKEEEIDSEKAEEIISSLKEVIDIPSTPKPTKKPTPKPEIVQKIEDNREKKEINQQRGIATNITTITTKEQKKPFKYDRKIQIDNSKTDMEDIDIMKLPCVEFIDDKKPIAIKKAIDEGVVYIPPSSADEVEPKNIPWAKLHDLDEKTDGILIKEPINY